MSRQLKLSLLGTFQVIVDSQPVTRFEYDKVRALLAFLAVESDAPHRRDTLAALLWPEQADKTAHKSLNQALYTLRKALADQAASDLPFIVADHTSVRLNPEADVWLDVHHFTRLSAEARASSGAEAAPVTLNRLRDALSLYHGDFLQGFTLPDSPTFDDWAALQRERLHGQATAALFTLASSHERQGEVIQAIEYARRLLALEPWREETHRLLMALLARSGQLSAALVQYERCHRILAEELGATPTPETMALYERIKAAGSTRRHNLPSQPTPFIGRQQELARLAQLVADPTLRLITLVGLGGMGKTRLALAAAANEVDNFAIDGVFFVELAAMGAQEDALAVDKQQIRNQIAGGIARAVGFQFVGDERTPERQLLDFLRHKAFLLILDSFEHLLEGANLISRILQAAPGVQILVTSREPLRLVEEQVFPVSGLAFSPDMAAAEDAAAVLFLQRARRARPDFVLTPAEVFHLTEVCRLVGGMPLALELAAAWVATLTLADIAGEIQRSLDILAADLRNLPPRQRSVAAVLEASWQRLPAAERRLLSRLSLFRSPFDHLAAQSVGEASLPALSALVTKSLLWRYQPPEAAGQEHARFTMHELVRRFAGQQLAAGEAEDAAARRAYVRYYVAFLKTRQASLHGPSQHQVLLEICPEYDNVRHAVYLACAAHDVATVGEIHDVLYWFFLEARLSLLDAEDMFGRMVAALDAAPAAGAQALAAREATLSQVLWQQAYFCAFLGELERAEALNRRGLELAQRHEEAAAEVAILNNLGGLALRRGDSAGSERFFRQALQKAEIAGNLYWLISTNENLARMLIDAGRGEDARPLVEAARQIQRERGVISSVNLILLGRLNMLAGALDEAGEQLTQAQDLLRETGGYPMVEVSVLINLGRLALRKGDRNEAQQHLTQALSLAREIGMVREIAEAEQLLAPGA